MIAGQVTVARSGGRFSRTTTVAELSEWWLDTIARHQVRTSTFDSYRRFSSYLVETLGSMPIVELGAETMTTWQSGLLDRYAPLTVLNCRKVCRPVFDEAVKLGLIPTNPLDLVKAPPAKTRKQGRALTAEEARQLIAAAATMHLGAAVTLLFCQGWRVSEVLGLAWEDLDLDAGTARIQRGASYSPSTGVVLTPTKTRGAEGIHHLAPISVAHLRLRQDEQDRERHAAGVAWPEHRYDGAVVSPVFSTATGALVNRQAINKLIERTARHAGIDPADIGSHTGRRTVVTTLFADGEIDLVDIARHVGHTDTATTARYVKSLGKRPQNTARKAAELLDPSVAGQTRMNSHAHIAERRAI